MRTVKGFTLVELMVTIAVLGIIAAIAVPSLATMVESSRASSQVNLYRDMLTLARAEAINRGAVVRVVQLADGSWVVGTGAALNSCAAAGAIRCFPAPNQGATLTTASIPAGGIAFTSQGYVRGLELTAAAPTLTIKFTDQCSYNRVISVSPIGRIRSEKGGC